MVDLGSEKKKDCPSRKPAYSDKTAIVVKVVVAIGIGSPVIFS